MITRSKDGTRVIISPHLTGLAGRVTMNLRGELAHVWTEDEKTRLEFISGPLEKLVKREVERAGGVRSSPGMPDELWVFADVPVDPDNNL